MSRYNNECFILPQTVSLYSLEVMLLQICLLFICTSSILANPVERKSWQIIIEECALEKGFDPTVEPDDSIENCIIACTMKRIGTMSEDGVYLPEEIINVLPKEYENYDKVVAAMKICSKKSGKDECDTVAVVRHCLAQNRPCADEHTCNIGSYQFLFYDPINNEQDASSDNE